MTTHEEAQARLEPWEYRPEEIVATNVPFDTYLARYAANFCEWDNGVVMKMSPLHERHDLMTRFLALLLAAYFELNPIGLIRQAPFVMVLIDQSYSPEPDLQVILKTNPHELTPTRMNGPADICIEVISPESVDRDRGRKFAAYERGGVREYWLIDPLRDEALFYRLNDDGIYLPQVPDADGNYQTPLLPHLRLHVPTLWQESLPGPAATVQAVQAMFNQP